jgi:hypothetical protein
MRVRPLGTDAVLQSLQYYQAAIIALFRVVNRYVGNLPPMPSVFPDSGSPDGAYRQGRDPTDGKAGTVESVFDELHGLRIFINGHDGKWPSTIKFAQPG